MDNNPVENSTPAAQHSIGQSSGHADLVSAVRELFGRDMALVAEQLLNEMSVGTSELDKERFFEILVDRYRQLKENK